MKNIKLLLLIIPIFLSVGCEDLFEPALENHKKVEDLYTDPALAQGLLGHAYISHPLTGWTINDVATDDAVSNDINSGLLKMATGQWRANNNPLERWRNFRGSIQYINQFLSIVDSVKWANDELVAEMFNDRLKGDAYGMRALYTYHLLVAHAGWTEDGKLLGIPILNEPEDIDSEFNLPRNTFQECIEQIYADVQKAVDLLPAQYGDITNNNQVPAKYRSNEITAAQYSRVFGDNTRNRMSAAIAEAVRAQATLLAASPAFSEGTTYTWEAAANQFAAVLNHLGADPVSQIDPTGATWYTNKDDITNLKSGVNPKEILWRGGRENISSLEEDNFPPTLFGRGRVNPSQNLVDAFPMENGYPISDLENSGYDGQNPYADRDPRLATYILYNGGAAGPGTTIITAADGTTNDALNKEGGRSTRTGYYLKKLLRQDVNANTSSVTAQYHYKAFIRYTEIFLSYAEAANEAWGPMGTGDHGYSAYDVVKAIRARAGIGKDNGDAYLESIKADQAAMRELIRNERRLELCFEGHRFWDLRRWKVPMSELTEPAKGMEIRGGVYKIIPEVEKRLYRDHMYHGPIPYDEVVKFSELQQNKGW